MYNKETRATRFLEENAENGDLRSLGQLLQGYRKEQVDIDIDKYLGLAIDYINDSKFQVTDINLVNIKRLKKFDINLHPELTVIIGENATGKTTVCQSIAKFLSWSASKIQKNKNGIYIQKEDVTNDETESWINGSLQLNKKYKVNYQLLLSLDSDKSSSFEELNLISFAIREVLEYHSELVELPIFAFYGVDRGKRIRKNADIRDYIRIEAYEDALKEETDIANLEDWLIRISNIELSSYKETLEKFTETITKNFQLNNSLDINKNNNQLIKNLIKTYQEEKQNNTPLKKLLNDSLQIFIEDFKSMEVDYPSGVPSLYLKFDSYKIDYSQMSHGQRSVINMVFDLVRRLAILNPHMEDPRKSKGIVIIDEIELHLHPAWQQNIINNLRSIFPNIQFIITTHSPMVLQSKYVNKSNIRVLKRNDEGLINTVTPSAQGLSVNDILLDVFKISVVEDNELSERVRKMKNIISDGKYESEEGKELYASLETSFGENSQVIKDINNLISFQELFN